MKIIHVHFGKEDRSLSGNIKLFAERFGLMTGIDDEAGIAAALTQLRQDPGAARRYAASARQRLDDFMSEESVCTDYMQVFRGDFDIGASA